MERRIVERSLLVMRFPGFQNEALNGRRKYCPPCTHNLPMVSAIDAINDVPSVPRFLLLHAIIQFIQHMYQCFPWNIVLNVPYEPLGDI